MTNRATLDTNHFKESSVMDLFMSMLPTIDKSSCFSHLSSLINSGKELFLAFVDAQNRKISFFQTE